MILGTLDLFTLFLKFSLFSDLCSIPSVAEAETIAFLPYCFSLNPYFKRKKGKKDSRDSTLNSLQTSLAVAFPSEDDFERAGL